MGASSLSRTCAGTLLRVGQETRGRGPGLV